MEDIREPMMISFLVILAIVVISVVIPMVTKSTKKTNEIFGVNENGATETVQATILSKRVYSPVGSLEKFNFIIFEKQNGHRIELAIKDDEQYKVMLEGDSGTLTHIGKRYISFIR